MSEYYRSDLSKRERARIVKSAVSPRPIAWISTRSTDGVDNLAPYSSYNYISSRNPLVMFNALTKSHGELKDSARNALETEEFAVNIAIEETLEQMDHTSANRPPTESEFNLAGVSAAEFTRINTPRVAESPVTMECTLYDSVEIRNCIAIFGDVHHFHIDESVLSDGQIDMKKLPTVGRLGGTSIQFPNITNLRASFEVHPEIRSPCH